MNFLQVGEAAIHYHAIGVNAAVRGGGKPVIAFVNSLGTDFRIWDAVIAALGDTYAYILHDKRSHGLSGSGTPPYAIDLHADDLAALLDHVEVEKAVVWGLSVGGLIAQSVAERRPDLVEALVLSNTAHRIGSPDLWNARIATIAAEGLSGIVDPVMERWFTPAFREDGNPLYAGCRAMLARQPADGYCGTCAAIREADLTEAAGRIAVPTLCVAGDTDGSTPPDLVASLAALIPGSRFAVMSACGHIPCIEQPAAYVATVAAFLKTLPETKR